MKIFQPAALILTVVATTVNKGSSRRILQDDPCYLDSPEFDLVWYDLLAAFDEWDCSLDFDFFDCRFDLHDVIIKELEFAVIPEDAWIT